MEEDIKILEELLQGAKDNGMYNNNKYFYSIENLIKGYRELKKNYINPSKARISYYDTKKGTEVVIEGFIPKSKVKELHKEYYEKAFAEPYDCTTADYKHSQAMGGWRALNKLLMEDK